MSAIEREFYAYLDEMQSITILLPYTHHEGKSSYFHITDHSTSHPLKIRSQIPLEDSYKYICECDKKIQIGQLYWIINESGEKTDLQIGAVIRTPQFDDEFFYEGELGITYTKESTLFRLWAPTATQVRLILQRPNDTDVETLEMDRKEKGTWIISVDKDLEGYKYLFRVCVNLEWKEAVDPYATAVTANGEMGVVIDFNKTNVIHPELPSLASPTDAIIYETHIRDFTIHPDSWVTNKGKYLGVAELETNYKESPTCLSYVKDLGVTHIEFLPFNDFEGVDELNDGKEYNWGYNPLHFNVPDGSYSTDPTNPYSRIVELKQLISTVHSQGLYVMMDVVYNHVYLREKSSFETIVPGYYFRHDEFGMPSNGTGVGNDIASERLMVRKFIVDSVKFWLEEYKVDGFRFDLMGILDIDTITEVRQVVDQINPNALIIGEGWDLNTPIAVEKKASIRNQKQLPRIGQFNDWFRDSIKGSTFNMYDRGYALGNENYYDAAKQVIAGSIGLERKENGIFLEPIQTVNYVESHDNHTLWDKLDVCYEGDSEDIKQKRHRLATAIVLLAQGIPFLHSGQEFFRTKNGIGNSYKSEDQINWLDWNRKANNISQVDYIKGLIHLRKSHGGFRLNRAELIRKHLSYLPLSKPIIGYMLKEVGMFGAWEDIIVIFNPTLDSRTENLPNGEWKVLADDLSVSKNPLDTILDQILLKPCSCTVLAR